MRTTLAPVMCILVTACGSAVPRGPEAAFDRLRVAVAARDGRFLYDALDPESRWAVDSVWQSHRAVATLVAAWPDAARERELNRVAAAQASATARELLTHDTARLGDPFVTLGGGAAGLGRLARVEQASTSAARIVTTTGLIVPVAAGPDGAWGYAGLRPTLLRWRDDAANDAKRLAEDAARMTRPPAH